MRRSTCIAVLVLIGVLHVASARAEAIPGERLANNPTLNQLVALAETFWQARDVEPCPQDRLEVMLDDGLTVNGRAVLGGCEAVFPTPLVAYVQSHPLSRVRALTLCTAVVHELGHTAGLGHTVDGVMSEDSSTGDTPFACRQWMRHRASSARLAR